MKNFKIKSLTLLLMLSLSLILITGIASAYSEAPELKEKVEKGELPSVEQRLPDNPRVVEPVNEVGIYGGTWDMFITSTGGTGRIKDYASTTCLVSWNRSLDKIVPSLAKNYEITEDGKVYTFYLREGLKWSDGNEFTADDILFWYNDIITNEKVMPSLPAFMKPAGKMGKVTKLDKYTVKFEFDNTYGTFLEYLAMPHAITWAPKHYLQKFHKDYANESELAQRVKDSDFNTWNELLRDKFNNLRWFMRDAELPTLRPWITTTEPPAEIFEFKRNPYFWMVDTEGNQLPYIDKISQHLVQDSEVLTMNVIAGKADLQEQGLSFANYSLYKTNEEEGNFKVLDWKTGDTNEMSLAFNLNVKDDFLQELFHNKKFRQALSYGINRNQINQVIFHGMGKIRQATAPEVLNQYYEEEYAKAYTKYNPEKANELLDELGLTEKNNQGYRLRPNGKPINLVFSVQKQFTKSIDVLELIKSHYEKIGIKTSINSIDRSLLIQQTNKGVTELNCGPSGFNPIAPGSHVPIRSNNRFAPLYGIWYATSGESGVEPPEKIKKLQELYDKTQTTTDSEEKTNALKEILEMHAENLWVIGTVGELPVPIIKQNSFQNVPQSAMFNWSVGGFFGHTIPAQYFIEEGAQE